MRHGSPEGEEPAAGPQPEEAGEAAANNWWFRFYGVPVNDNGEKVTYSIVMDSVAGYNTEAFTDGGAWFTNTLLPQSVTVAFDANGGEGEMASVEIDPMDEYELPENGFTAPEGMEFAGWLVGEDTCQAGDAIVVTGDTTVIAQWQEAEVPEETADAISVTVTFEVVNGAWDDGTREPKTIILTGSEGEELRLNPSDIPDVTAPDEGYELGAWDTEPPTFMEEYDLATGEPITEDTTYTYTYAEIETADTGAPTEEQPIEDEPVEEQPVVEEQFTEQQTEDGPQKPSPVGEGGATAPDEVPEEQPSVEEEPVEEEQAATEQQPVEEYSIEGGVFDAWMVSSSDGSDPVAYQPGEAIKVTGDMTVTASWLFDDSAMEFGAGEIEYGGESDANAVANDNGTGLSVETEDASTGAEGLTLSGEPSEAGSVFNSAGIAAIIAAAVLVLVGAVIVIVKKKKK